MFPQSSLAMLHDGVQAIPKVENGDLFVSEHHHHIQLPHVLGSHGARHLNTLAGYYMAVMSV